MTPNLSALTAAFVGGSSVFAQKVLGWDIRNYGIQVRTNVKSPQALTKLSAEGNLRPYRSQDDITTGPKFTDRTLTAYMGKWDFDFDPENFRNTYLATNPEQPFEQAAVAQVSKTFLDQLYRLTLYSGVRNGAGTGAADVFSGWGTLIAAEITGLTLTPVATGAITTANAVTKVEQVADAVPMWMMEMGHRIYCSYDVFKKYAAHYRTLNGFQFQKNATGEYQLDNRRAVLTPVAFMGTSQRLIATIDDNLVFGTDLEGVSMYPTPNFNILKVRLMMAGGCQIQDLEALVVNDQA